MRGERLGKKYPNEIYCLFVCYVIGILVDFHLVYKQIVLERPVFNIVLIALPSLLLLTMIVLLFVRKRWAFVALWIMYLPISLCGWVIAIAYFALSGIHITVLLMICGIITVTSMTNKSVRHYFLGETK